MTPTELLTKRVRCIASGGAKEHYPGSPFEVGEVLAYESYGAAVYVGNTSSATALTVDSNPHLFEQMAWWEDRKVEDMPGYVKLPYNGSTSYVHKVERWAGVNCLGQSLYEFKGLLYGQPTIVSVSWLLPATPYEYYYFITKQSTDAPTK